MAIRVSVIIPVYNTEKYLRECLDSVVSQTLEDIEIIAINDGSPDGSLSILKEYASRDCRIVIIDKQNEGVGRARNDGINAASGEFAAFMDSDDYYPGPGVLETLYNAAKRSGVSIAGGRRIMLLADGTFDRSGAQINEFGDVFAASGLTEYSDFQYDYGYTQYIYSLEMLKENGIYFPPYKRFQDPPFFVRAMYAAGRFFMTDCESYCYRMVPSEAKYSAESTLDFLAGLTDNIKFSREKGLSKLHRLSAKRLDREGSFMATKNLYGSESDRVLCALIGATAAVDTDWLREEGLDPGEPFLPEVFRYLAETAGKYEKLRNGKIAGAVRKIKGKK